MERLELLRNVCRDAALRNLSHTAVSKFVLDRIFVCDKHKILFCQTPKVGNTQWKKVLIVLNGIYSAVGVWVSLRRRKEQNWSNWDKIKMDSFCFSVHWYLILAAHSSQLLLALSKHLLKKINLLFLWKKIVIVWLKSVLSHKRVLICMW